MQNIQKCTITININRPKRRIGGIFTARQGDRSDQVHSDQMVLKTVRWEADPQERRPKVLKTKTQGKPSALSPFRSDNSCDCQVGGWTS
jgi:hypothetical protein